MARDIPAKWRKLTDDEAANAKRREALPALIARSYAAAASVVQMLSAQDAQSHSARAVNDALTILSPASNAGVRSPIAGLSPLGPLLHWPTLQRPAADVPAGRSRSPPEGRPSSSKSSRANSTAHELQQNAVSRRANPRGGRMRRPSPLPIRALAARAALEVARIAHEGSATRDAVVSKPAGNLPFD